MAPPLQGVWHHKAEITLPCREHTDRKDHPQTWAGEMGLARGVHRGLIPTKGF